MIGGQPSTYEKTKRMNDNSENFPYLEFIDGLEEAIYWHNAWYSRGMRHLIFNIPANEDLLARDAHIHCKLGGFLAHLPTPPGHEALKAQSRGNAPANARPDARFAA